MDNRIWLSKPGLSGGTFPDYLDKWGVPYILCPNWDKIGRSGDSGFDSVLGVINHHDAIGGTNNDTWRSSIPPRWGGNRIDGPVGNGSLDFDGVLHLWAGGAANTAGQGGPLLGSRGVIAKDNANRTTVNWEKRNNGIGAAWTPAQVESDPRLNAASLDWANNETPGVPLGVGDLWSHALDGPGWTNRKIDPATPAGTPWGPPQNSSGTWNMHAFRATVFQVQMGFNPTPPVEDDMTDTQAAQLAELYTALVANYPGPILDPQGSPMNAAWAAAYAEQLTANNVIPLLVDIQKRLAVLEAK